MFCGEGRWGKSAHCFVEITTCNTSYFGERLKYNFLYLVAVYWAAMFDGYRKEIERERKTSKRLLKRKTPSNNTSSHAFPEMSPQPIKIQYSPTESSHFPNKRTCCKKSKYDETKKHNYPRVMSEKKNPSLKTVDFVKSLSKFSLET